MKQKPGELDDNGDPVYQYPFDLHHGQIRLLKLGPGLGDEDLVHFEFVTTYLPPEGSKEECKQPYFALSYVWGEETNKRRIRIDGQDMCVTRNLYSALTNLRSELEQLPIWTDAACIRQWPKVNQEKDRQLDRMGDVYRYATHVLVHLGETDRQTDNVMERIQRIGEETYNLGAMVFRDNDLAFWPDFEGCDNRQAKVSIRESLDRRMDAVGGGFFSGPAIPTSRMVELFSRPCFFRGWIIQELVLARDEPGTVVFACGKKNRVKWEHLWGAFFFLTAWINREARHIENALGIPAKLFQRQKFIRRVGIQPTDFEARTALTMGIRKKYLQHELGLQLKSLLIRLHVGDTNYAMGCRDYVDKINAVRGMAIDGAFLSEIRRPNTEWKEYFIALTDRLIRQGHIDLLSICRHRDSTLPSWVVDWSRQQWRPWLGFRNVQASDSEQLFDAGAGTTFTYHPSDSPRILNLHGFHIDTIIEVSQPWPHGSVDVGDPKYDEDPKTGVKPHKAVHSLKPDLKPDQFHFGRVKIRLVQLAEVMKASPIYTEEQAMDAIWRILVVDKEMNERWQVTRATDVTRRQMDDMAVSIQSRSPMNFFDINGGSSCVNMMLSLYGSRILVSKKGYVGLCHFNTAAGDIIFLPSGAHCPYTMRPVSHADGRKTWKLLREAYVHGIMDGELRTRLGDEEHRAEVVSLE